MAKTHCRKAGQTGVVTLFSPLQRCADLRVTCGSGIDGGDGTLGGHAGHLGVAVINSLIGYIQESNAEKSLQSIRNMLSSEAVVVRQGNHETIPTTALVHGDIVVIRAGDRIPADLRIIEAHNLRVEEAILTGESTVVEKITDRRRRTAAGRPD